MKIITSGFLVFALVVVGVLPGVAWAQAGGESSQSITFLTSIVQLLQEMVRILQELLQQRLAANVPVTVPVSTPVPPTAPPPAPATTTAVVVPPPPLPAGPNLPPVITSFSGSARYFADATGTWAVIAYDPNGTPTSTLTASVDWGDTGRSPEKTFVGAGAAAHRFTFDYRYGTVRGRFLNAAVTDGDGATARKTTDVLLYGFKQLVSNQAPVVTITGPTDAGAAATSTWTVSVTDGDVNLAAFYLQWGDGTSMSEDLYQMSAWSEPLAHRYETGGVKTITATAWDRTGVQTTRTFSVTVE